ncbi:MAG: archaellin/type IV pilin N-terminal domain-containing protein [Nanoarchaeota archaeon]
MTRNKGLSTVVASLLLVLLTIVLVGIVWTVVTNLTEESLDRTSSCLNTFEKVTLGNEYSCYNLTTKEFQFSVNIEDIDVEKVLVGISAEGTTKSVEIKAENATSNILRSYKGNYGGNFALPEKNAGLTYVYNMTRAGFSGAPKSIRIVPVINGNQCDESDNLLEIFNC